MNYHLGGHILHVSHKIKLGIESEFEDQIITGFQGRIIGFIFVRNSRKLPVYQKDIENEFKINRSSVTSVLNTMKKNGYVKREAVESDARLKLVVLTDKGKKAAKKNLQTIVEFEQRLVQGLSQKDVEKFKEMLDIVLDNLKKEERKK